MENVISDYRAALKKKILERTNGARFYMEFDNHPMQYELIEDILSDDFHVTYEYIILDSRARQYYITGYLPSQKSVFTGSEEVEVEDVKE